MSNDFTLKMLQKMKMLQFDSSKMAIKMLFREVSHRVKRVKLIHLYFSNLYLLKELFVLSSSLLDEEVAVGIQQKDNKNALLVGEP